ncbi:choice-of-anchor L domain-containing protein [Flavobacterium sp.]|uniref:choice-of-anchor L domain-containing protein n=1 Tax=Flavobacterium sp. TaxID=239 RepID=UPI0026211D66|nr:choice-of-anchor L domain-containing protein [Flavobacterium sp.]MDD3003637.1 choice-of-anchor L domain-containing protein [Flavobacterium sp.]
MRKLTYSAIGILSLALFTVSCEKNDSDTKDSKSIYKIINDGTAGVSEVTDSNDFEGLNIAQAIPSVSGETYPASMPILFFFDDKILLPSITAENFMVTENEKAVKGTIHISEQANGYAILSFIPTKKFAANSDIKIVITADLHDDAGLGNDQDYVLEYTTSSVSSTGFSNNLGFENGSNGVMFVGDGNLMDGTESCVAPFGGNNFASITSGSQLISTESAIGGATSMMILGPINSNVSSVSFNYNFLSAEFQEYVGSQFDDSFMAIVAGPNGAHAEFITSVNTIGTANTACSSFPGMPDNGDSYFGTTGWINKQMSFNNTGNDTYIIFLVTDVSDTIYSSIVCIDDISYN